MMKEIGRRRLEKLKALIDNQSNWPMATTCDNEYARIELVQKSLFHEFYAIVITKVNYLEYYVEDGCVLDANYYKWFQNKFEQEITIHLRGTHNQLIYGSAMPSSKQ